jgi:hypothetical protein
LLPLLLGRGPERNAPAPMIELQPACVQMTASIPDPDGYRLRLLNASDDPTDATVRLAPRPSEVAWLTLAGDSAATSSPSDGVIRRSMRPWEIATLRVRR